MPRSSNRTVAATLAVSLLAAGVPALVPCTARAAEVAGLYEAEAPVPDREAATRKGGFAEALRGVFVKVSGRRDPRSSPVVADALRRADAFVQQYGYTVVAVPGAGAGALPSDELRLRASFDAGAVDAVLADAGLPVWGRNRPSVVTWIALERDGSRELVGADDPGGLARASSDAAAARGIPLVVPLLDLEDRAAVRATDVWAGFGDVIRTASARYGADATLTARVYQVLPTLWEARFGLVIEGAEREWTAQAPSARGVLAAGAGAVADALASRFASPAFAGTATGVEVVVVGVETLEDYAATLRYLGALDEISALGVSRVEADTVVFDVDARGGAPALRQVVALGQVLAEEPAALAQGGLRFALRR